MRRASLLTADFDAARGTSSHWSIRAGWRHSPVANRLGVNNPTRSTRAGHSLAYGTTQIIGKLLVLLKH